MNDEFFFVDFNKKCPYTNEDEIINDMKRLFVVDKTKDKIRFGFKNVVTHKIDYVGRTGASQRLKSLHVMKELVKRVEYFDKGKVVSCEEKYKTVTAWDFYLAHSEEFE